MDWVRDLVVLVKTWLPYVILIYVVVLVAKNYFVGLKVLKKDANDKPSWAKVMGYASANTFKDMKEHLKMFIHGLASFGAGVAERQAKQAEEAKKEQKQGDKE